MPNLISLFFCRTIKIYFKYLSFVSLTSNSKTINPLQEMADGVVMEDGRGAPRPVGRVPRNVIVPVITPHRHGEASSAVALPIYRGRVR